MFGRKPLTVQQIADEKVIRIHRLIQTLCNEMSSMPERYYLRFIPGSTAPRQVALMDGHFVPATQEIVVSNHITMTPPSAQITEISDRKKIRGTEVNS